MSLNVQVSATETVLERDEAASRHTLEQEVDLVSPKEEEQAAVSPKLATTWDPGFLAQVR